MLKILFAGLLWEGGTRCNDFLIIGQCFALQQKFTLARELKVILLYQPSQTRTIPRKSPTPLPCFAPSPLPPLSKVRCCRPKKFGRLPEGLLAPLRFAPHSYRPLSKVRCCRPKKFGRLPEGLSHHPLPLHQPSPNRTIPRKPPTPLPPLSKGGGLTARHKPLYCCFLLVPRPPFLFTKPFCRQDGGIASPPFALHHILTAHCQR